MACLYTTVPGTLLGDVKAGSAITWSLASTGPAVDADKQMLKVSMWCFHTGEFAFFESTVDGLESEWFFFFK
jgi:hypothetical protein